MRNKKFVFGAIFFLFCTATIYIIKPASSVSTDNSYLKSDIINIKAKVSGYIVKAFISENEPVKSGQILAKIDDTDYQLKLKIAEANLESNKEKIKSAELELGIQEFIIEKAKYDINNAAASLELANKNLKRSEMLAKDKTVAQKELDQSLETQKKAANDFFAAKSNLQAAELKKDLLSSQINNLKFINDTLKSAHELAKLDLSYTEIKAETDGRIGKHNFQVGQYANSNSTLAYLVQDNIWLNANFKEVQIEKLKPGQEAIIEIDSFPGKKFKGKLDSLSPATGAEFSLLPPENATGNFTKIVQRIPVKIIFNQDQDLSMLRSGMSCVVKVKFD